ncbi:MAG: hypothetical protein ACRBBP_08465 [Bdellovibrionales bacterium]
MINLKSIITVIFTLVFSMGSFAALVPMPEEQDNQPSQNSVLPPIGVLNCAECVKSFKEGANSADLELTKWHEKQIFGSDGEGGSSNSVDGD